MKKTFLNWSSGKDAALSLYLLQQDPFYSVKKLFTSLNTKTDSISMHGIPRALLEKQAESLGVPLQVVEFPGILPLDSYNGIMKEETSKLLAEGFTHSAFGDILLEDLKAYREQQLAAAGLKAVFPLWGRDTDDIMQEFLRLGFRAIIVSVSADRLDASFCGRILDESFLADLPDGVDPCGENGEFHSFVFDGPNFSFPLPIQKGNVYNVQYTSGDRERIKDTGEESTTWDSHFYYCNLLPS